MIKYFIYTSLILFLLTNNSFSEISVKITPDEKVYQGNHLTLEIEDSSIQDKNFVVTINNKSNKAYRLKKGKYICFFAFPADMKEGKYKVIIKEDNKDFYDGYTNIIKKSVGTQNISYYKPKLSKEDENKIKEEDELVEKTKSLNSDINYWNTPFILPVNDYISGIYGIKRLLNGKYNNYHTGVDFASSQGTKIKAVNSGKITLAKYFSKYNSNGNIVFIDHGLGVSSAYLHLSKILVKEGEIVKQGQPIGLVGSTGRSTGPHLHWGLYLNGQNTDGDNWVKFTNKNKNILENKVY